jgi:uncharacterized protein YifN (PemK superfamily)
MVHSAVPAGTVLHFDFSELNLSKPEFVGEHPVLVLSPESKQKDGTAIIVPITSAISNAHNVGAVEITNSSFVRTSPTGRSFAICDKPYTVALSRLAPFNVRRRQGANYQPNYQIRGQDLANARMALFGAVNSEPEVRRLFANGALVQLWSKLKERQKASAREARSGDNSRAANGR